MHLQEFFHKYTILNLQIIIVHDPGIRDTGERNVAFYNNKQNEKLISAQKKTKAQSRMNI